MTVSDNRHDRPTPADQRGEREFLRRLGPLLGARNAPGRPSPADFGDDMARVDPAEPGLLWTADMIMDGVDFDSRVHAWTAAGRKAMAVNLSDCAAMAVVPVSALCAVALNDRMGMEDALDILRGANNFGCRHGCPVVGGDTNSWTAPTAISISIAARALPGLPPVGRAGAQPGDRVWLTGPVGGSLLGRHLTFEPRVEVALQIRRTLAPHALIDISDGLSLDLWRILEASGCGAEIDAAALAAVIHPDAVRLSAQDGRPAREHALSDGEDFELVVVLPPDVPDDACAALGLLPLGRVIERPELVLRTPGGALEPLAVAGWEHFR